ncbi:MAG: hypothetical protein JWP12_3275 [Bacteroidetes bacterium]|nr:hypothetical protein [Bacteroidota bacterium]
MSLYIKEFDPAITGRFGGLVSITGTDNKFLVGGMSGTGLTVTVDADGNVVGQTEYTLEDETKIAFISAADINDHTQPGDYILFGAYQVTTTNVLALLIRIDSAGNVIWAKTYGDGNTIRPLQMILSLDTAGEERYNSFMFISKRFVSKSVEDIEGVRVDMNGDLEASTIFGLQSTSIQTAGLAPTASGGAIIYGGTTIVTGYDSFVISVTKTFVIASKKVIKTTVYSELRSITPGPSAGEFIFTGDLGASASNKNQFIVKISSGSTSVTANSSPLLTGTDMSLRKVLEIDGNYYMFGYKAGGSYAAKYNSSLSLVWSRNLTLGTGITYFLADAIYDSDTDEIVIDGWMKNGTFTSPFNVRTDTDFTSCVTTSQDPEESNYTFTITNITKLTPKEYTPPITDIEPIVSHYPIPDHKICPAPDTIPLDGLVQSPYIYMQAAGSDVSDHSSEGIHLRWRFNKSLGDNHFAKGPYANPSSPYYTTVGFSTPDDYVKIYKVPYSGPYQAKVKFQNAVLPTTEISTGTTREWHYNGITLTNSGVGTTNIIIRFSNLVQYDTIRATMSPLLPEDFMKQYTGIILVAADTKTIFSIQFNVLYNPGSTSSAYIRAESIAYNDPMDTTTTFVTARKTFTGPTQLASAIIKGETMAGVRLDYSIAYVSEIVLETYYDYINTINSLNLWAFMGDYALTLQTPLAYDRLENDNNPYVSPAKKYAVDKAWDKYNDSDASTGEFKIRVENYQHRWYPAPDAEHPDTIAADGIQNTIEQYLNYSVTDPKAVIAVPVEDDPGNDAVINISYFDILRLVGIDYHIARMMGLGLIDAEIPNDGTAYVHLMVYTSHGALETGDPSTRVQSHLYMTLPTTLEDYRLPTAPIQEFITYGMSVSNGIGEINQLTDADGYVAYDDVRFVQINREIFDYEIPWGSFFYNTTEFDLSKETIPVMYGIDYKGVAESVYRKPEITQDEEYFDYAGYNEVVEIPEQGQTNIYTHQEREEGIHCYALYAINWFSRISPLSNQECTDYTKFRKAKNLMPPSNFAVQLIQPEQPIMFTTQGEQTALAAIATADKTLLRATFEWNHTHNVNYQYAERAQLFYRETAPDSISGQVVSITQLANHQVLVKVTSMTILSTSPVQTVSPAIPTGEESKYIGSTFATASQAFAITVINNTGTYPEFTLNQIRETSSYDPLNNNQFTTLVNWLQPTVGDRFLVVENLAVDPNWSTHLNRTVYLEKFHTNFTIALEATGTANNGTYKIEHVTAVGSNTEIVVLDKLKSSTVAGNIRYNKVFTMISIDAGTSKIKIAGNITADLTGLTIVRVFGSSYSNDAEYTISGTPAFVSGNTEITVTGPIADATTSFGYMAIEKTATITGINMLTQTVTVAGNLTSVIIPPYVETKINYDSTETKFSYGGIFQPAHVTQVTAPDPITGLPVAVPGVYNVLFNTYTLLPHIDPGVEWYKGTLRISDTNTATIAGVPQAVIKALQVWEIKKDISGVPLVPLELIIYDPAYATDPFPIKTGTNINVNFHPSYRLYLKAEFNSLGNNDSTHQFNGVTILPAPGDGSKITYLGIRSLDHVKEQPANVIVEYDSYIAPLVPVLAQEIVTPEKPELAGPLFATRPDFYKKSTYTVDIKLNTTDDRKPYGVLVYRGSEIKVLDTLYNETTLATILTAVKQLKVTDTAAYYDMLYNLVNVTVDPSTGNFQSTANSLSFDFPLPDNGDYIVPNRDSSVIVHPFATPTSMLVAGQEDLVRQAVLDSFLSLTEQPVIYKYVKGGITTSPRKPIYRTYNGDIITPILPETPGYNPDNYDPHPMAVKFAKNGTVTLLPSDVGYSISTNDFYIRFTDYTLDGASTAFYFYYSREITNQLVIGPPSGVKAPVLMVNAAPAQAPGIREVITILEDPANNIETSVSFKLTPFNETEGITQFWIYRAYNAADASNIRTMKLGRKVDVGQPVIDDFADLLIPPYGETLFYKIVAVRRIQNELLLPEDILSLPSNAALTNVVDVINPQPPVLMSENGTSTLTLLQDVVLTWDPTCYNGTYRLQKLNTSGNWVEIYSIKVKDDSMQYPPIDPSTMLPDFTTYPETQSLPRVDADGNPIYYRFRVEVENSSGLFNLTEYELTLGKGASDLQEIPSVVSFADSHAHTLPVLVSKDFITGSSQPDTISFTYLDNPLPAGHNTFIKVDITMADDLGHSATHSIVAPATTATFTNGDGTGLVLNSPNIKYTVTTNTFTDFVPNFPANGAIQTFTINYLAGPCYDLQQVTDIVKYDDDTHTINPFVSGYINDGGAYTSLLTFTDITDLPAIGETFGHIDITVTDSVNSTPVTKQILSVMDFVTFDNTDGIATGSANPNITYTVNVKLFSLECTTGYQKDYSITYTYTPCDQLAGLTNIASYEDANSTSINPIADTTVTLATDPNVRIFITDLISGSLPSGHTFDHMDVILEDDLGGAYILSSVISLDTYEFLDGDGGLDLSTAYRTYFVTIVLYTDLCTNGTSYAYTIKYA